MSLITKPNTFTAGQSIVASQHNSNFDTIYNDYNGNITDANLSNSANIALSKISGSADWTNFGGTATVTGWSTRTQTDVYYKRIGKEVFMMFAINGTSNATVCEISLPFALDTNAIVDTLCGAAMNSGTALANPARIANIAAQNIAIYADMWTGTWAATGQKQIRGNFFYASA